jgi:hypothetical protein
MVPIWPMVFDPLDRGQSVLSSGEARNPISTPIISAMTPQVCRGRRDRSPDRPEPGGRRGGAQRRVAGRRPQRRRDADGAAAAGDAHLCAGPQPVSLDFGFAVCSRLCLFGRGPLWLKMHPQLLNALTRRKPPHPAPLPNHSRRARAIPAAAAPPTGSSGGHHAHRALLNAQVHGLNLKLERLAAQHAALLAGNAQQQELWEGQASQDLRDVKEAIGQLATMVAPAQRQVAHLETRVARLQGQLASQRALATVQHFVMALALLALGTGWAPTALWALAAAAAAAVAAVLFGFGADDSEELRAAAAERQLAAQQLRAGFGAASAAGAPHAIHAMSGATAATNAAAARDAATAFMAKGADGSALRVMATACGAGEAAPAPAPMTDATRELLVGTAMAGKTIDETVGLRVFG